MVEPSSSPSPDAVTFRAGLIEVNEGLISFIENENEGFPPKRRSKAARGIAQKWRGRMLEFAKGQEEAGIRVE